MFINKKNAFTLTEVLICIVIVGFLSAFAIDSLIKAQDRSLRYKYSSLYTNLSEAHYNALITKYIAPAGSDYDTGDPFDSSLIEGRGADVLCRKLVEYIDTFAEDCSASNLVDPAAEDFTDTLKFVAQNGMKFYISDKQTIDPGDDFDPIYFYLVYVDLNGDKGPNILDNNPNVTEPPDIVGFALVDNGYVTPLGLPEVDTRYMMTRLIYIDNNKQVYKEPSQAYYITKNEAWGIYKDVSENLNFDIDVAFSLNDRIRNSIAESSRLNISFSPTGTDVYEKCSDDDERFKRCIVKIDTYKF